MAIENYARDECLEGSTDRVFGMVFATFFTIIGFLPTFSGGQIRIWAIAVAGAFLFLGLIWPTSLSGINRLWMRFGLLLGKAVSPIALGIVFYSTLVPIGLIFRLLGTDHLRLKKDPAASSYWIQRDPPGPDSSTLDRQF